MATQQEYELILQKCKDIPPAKNVYLIHDYVENLLLTVLDFQMHNVSVAKAIAHYRQNRYSEIRTLADLQCFLSRYTDDKEGNTSASQYIWGNKHWTRVSLLRKLVAYFESIGVTSQEALSQWARDSDYQKDFEGKIPGMAYAIYQWLIMRQGIETIKPDTHLLRFVESVIHHRLEEQELVDVLEEVARELGLRAYELDWRIWEYQRGQPGTI